MHLEFDTGFHSIELEVDDHWRITGDLPLIFTTDEETVTVHSMSTQAMNIEYLIVHEIVDSPIYVYHLESWTGYTSDVPALAEVLEYLMKAESPPKHPAREFVEGVRKVRDTKFGKDAEKAWRSRKRTRRSSKES